MPIWWQLATRAWRTRPGRTALTAVAVALGVAVVVWVTCCYESVRQSINRVVLEWVGAAHVIVEPVEGVWAVFSGDMEAEIAALPGVIHTTSRTREFVQAAGAHDTDATSSQDRPSRRIEVMGIVPEKEKIFRTYKLFAGRFIEPGDDDAIVVEKLLADDLRLQLGDKMTLQTIVGNAPPRPFVVVGIIDRRRASVNQAPMVWTSLKSVQQLVGLAGRIKGIDIMVADPGVPSIRRTAEAVREIIDRRNAARPGGEHVSEVLNVKTTETQQKKLGAAQGLLQFTMLLLSCVVLLTAFFIILASMSMGVSERITELGLLRCIGVTRQQLGGIVLLQNLPLGLIGTIAGVPIGLALQWITMRYATGYLGEMVISGWGMALACGGGIGTTLLGSILPAAGAIGVSPVAAVRALGTRRSARGLAIAFAAGVVLLVGHELSQRNLSTNEGQGIELRAIVSLVLLYGGCALAAPLIVVVVGKVAVRIAAFCLLLRPQLLKEEIDHAPYRSAAVCCGLAVGLSLIVGLIVWGQSVKEGWRFPSEFPDAMLYSYAPMPLEELRALRDTPGLKDFTVCDDFPFSLSKPSKIPLFKSLSMLDQSSRFLAVEPDEGLALVKLAFLEGDESEARELLKQGGHVLVTREFSQARNLHRGDVFDIWVGQKQASFKIAGVVGSAGVDIAVSFFNATEFFQFYAVGAVFGSLDDARKLFGRRSGTMMLFNFDETLSAEARVGDVSRDSKPIGPTAAAPGERQTFAMGPGPIPESGPQEAVVNSMLKRLGYPPKAFVTARELKTQIDGNINRVTLLLSAIPAVGLLIAALGVANLMAANVASRARQIAVLRAIGVTRRQMARIVIGEAVVLGVIGSAIGVALGLLLARTSNHLTSSLSGFEPVFAIHWSFVGLGAATATLLCVLAALVPAIRASRASVVSVLAAS